MIQFHVWPNMTKHRIYLRLFHFDSFIGVSIWVVKWRLNLWWIGKKRVSK